jgi:molybdopterin molybdotransferase
MRPFGLPADESLLQVDEALQRILAAIQPLGTEEAAVTDAAGRVLREDVVAGADVPFADNSAMDGYALRSEDTTAAPARLAVLGDLPAGSYSNRALEPGTALRIMTGAAIPPGADAVAQVEITDGGGDAVTIRREVPKGANIRRRGEDMRAGELILRDGVRLGAGEAAAAAIAGRAVVAVGRRPSVAIVATGDELAEPGRATSGRVVDSNSVALSALVRETGGVAVRRASARDSLDATVQAIESAAESDFIVTTGGVSVGAYDFVKDALTALGAKTHFWRIAMKPGKPLVFATLRDRVFFGLPGNPVSAMVCFILFVAPALRRAQGQTSDLTAPIVMMKTRAALKGVAERRSYLRVRVVSRSGELVAEPMASQGSHIATSMVGANGLAIVEADQKEVPAGSMVAVMMTGPVISA